MFEYRKIEQLDNFFKTSRERGGKYIYFCRINGYNDEIFAFLLRYEQEARRIGCIIDGKLPNPTEQNLSYYGEMMGMDFQLSMGFLTTNLAKWLPRMSVYQNNCISGAIYDTLYELLQAGKTQAILKNTYIKFMCWLYYRFESVLRHLGGDIIPKILYHGEISSYELKILKILSDSGCDVLLLQPCGDAAYLKLDTQSKYSEALSISGGFPADFSLKLLREQSAQKQRREQLLGDLPSILPSTNSWISGKALADISSAISNRGNESNRFYNCFYRISGVQDKLCYIQELYQFYKEVQNSKRKIVVVDGELTAPTMDEIAKIVRTNYQSLEQMVSHLSQNIKFGSNSDLQCLMRRAFCELMLEDESIELRKKLNYAVYILCWLNRYKTELFSSWRFPEISCFIRFGACSSAAECMFMRMLARLPIDVLILNPNLNITCMLQDKNLREEKYNFSLAETTFPKQGAKVSIGTAAYHAEQELTEILYSDSGMYRNQQYGCAEAITLHTMYEEIGILWDAELKFRPSFQVLGQVVSLPVIFAKVSGVKDNKVDEYWSNVKKLETPDTYFIKNVPFIRSTDENPVKAHAFNFIKRDKLQKAAIKAHKCYKYGFLRDDMQEHILNKLQVLISEKRIVGTFENGTEFTIISTVLNMNQQLLRMIQKYDFTQKSPKLVYIYTGEQSPSLEDAILLAFLNLIGFDIVMFVPTGYQCVERFYTSDLFDEHTIGTYTYDLEIPDFSKLKSPHLWGKFFGRGV